MKGSRGRLWHSGPRHYSGHVVIGQIEFRQLGTYRIATMNAHRGENDLTGTGLHVKVFGSTHGQRHALGQRELVFGSDLGERGNLRKVRNYYFSVYYTPRPDSHEIGRQN